MPRHGLDVHFERISKFGLVEVGSAGEGRSDAVRDFIHGRLLTSLQRACSVRKDLFWPPE
jgi:hypothetical protein